MHFQSCSNIATKTSLLDVFFSKKSRFIGDFKKFLTPRSLLVKHRADLPKTDIIKSIKGGVETFF